MPLIIKVFSKSSFLADTPVIISAKPVNRPKQNKPSDTCCIFFNKSFFGLSPISLNIFILKYNAEHSGLVSMAAFLRCLAKKVTGLPSPAAAYCYAFSQLATLGMSTFLPELVT